jgi:hypothetical protein
MRMMNVMRTLPMSMGLQKKVERTTWGEGR